MKRQTIKQGRRPRDIELVRRHYDRKRTHATLRQLARMVLPRWDRRGLR